MLRKRLDTYKTYWYFAAERQNIFFNKIEGYYPLTMDKIFQTYKFCNTYRASDRLSQFLIKDIIYKTKFSEKDTLFRIFFYRLLNKSETWESLEGKLGEYISLNNFSIDRYSKILQEIKEEQGVIYGNAFMLASTKVYGSNVKHINHLTLLDEVFIKTDKHKKLLASKSLSELYKNLHSLPMIGDFMAYQISIDFNYSEVFCFDENDFTVAGPGAIRGIYKCFEDIDKKSYEYVIQYMVENQKDEFEKYNIQFKDLWGRPLKAIDCQNIFCETDKYCREKFPEIKTNRSKIKAKYILNANAINYFYPPKWGINEKVNLKST